MEVENRALRAKDAAKILAISKSMVYKLALLDEDFPQGFKVGKSRVWLLDDLLTYLRKQPSTFTKKSTLNVK